MANITKNDQFSVIVWAVLYYTTNCTIQECQSCLAELLLCIALSFLHPDNSKEKSTLYNTEKQYVHLYVYSKFIYIKFTFILSLIQICDICQFSRHHRHFNVIDIYGMYMNVSQVSIIECIVLQLYAVDNGTSFFLHTCQNMCNLLERMRNQNLQRFELIVLKERMFVQELSQSEWKKQQLLSNFMRSSLDIFSCHSSNHKPLYLKHVLGPYHQSQAVNSCLHSQKWNNPGLCRAKYWNNFNMFSCWWQFAVLVNFSLAPWSLPLCW